MKIGVLIPVRLASERLPGKALKSLVGRPVLHHLLDRAFASRHLRPDAVIVCTTTAPEDDALVSVVESTGARVFRGSAKDLVDRLGGAMRAFGLDIAIEIDGDDPCTDPLYMDACVDRLLADPEVDVAVTQGLPLGIGCKAVRRRAFEVVARAYRTIPNDTGFMLYFTKSGLCRVDPVFPVSQEHVHDAARLTLDYPEDLNLFRAIFERLYRPGCVFGLEDILRLLRAEPNLLALNAACSEEYRERTRLRAQLEFEVKGVRQQVTWA